MMPPRPTPHFILVQPGLALALLEASFDGPPRRADRSNWARGVSGRRVGRIIFQFAPSRLRRQTTQVGGPAAPPTPSHAPPRTDRCAAPARLQPR